VKLPDANILIYALDDTSVHHEKARNWLENTLSGRETVAWAWQVLLAVVRITTKQAIFLRPFQADEILDVVDGWTAQPNTVVIHPSDRHATVLRNLLVPVGTAGNLTVDAHLAALAIEHGAELCSADSDFARFPGLRWSNPLVPR